MDPWPGMLSIRIQVKTYVQRKQREETPISTPPPWPPCYKNKDANSSPERIQNVLKEADVCCEGRRIPSTSKTGAI